MTLAHSTFELMWLEFIFAELNVPVSTPTLLCDNLSDVLLSYNLVLHARNNHSELDIHFVRERVVSKKLMVQHVFAAAQVDNTLTKHLGTTAFQDLRAKLMVVSASHSH